LEIGGDVEIALNGSIETGLLLCSNCSVEYPIKRGIPRFVQSENYAENFGVQWNIYRRTQLDSHSGQSISRDRFEQYTGWHLDAMAGKRVLDVGAGAGRFAEIAVKTGAHVIAVDYSNAIDAARMNLGDNNNIDFVQADAAALPFAWGTFDKVYCLGVIQHTPEPDVTFASLAAQTKAGGALAIDVYPKHWKNLFFAKYWIRPITRRLTVKRGLSMARLLFPILYPVSQAVGRIPKIGRYIKYVIPVVNYEGVYPLNKPQLREWALLDTFDMWAPAYDHPQTMPTIRKWFEKAGFSKIEVFHSGFYVGRGIKTKD
jgi:2-polyprenyl-3-methyl-5-hydroxy-6-metoxy-1,4-benzoquinol methylase